MLEDKWVRIMAEYCSDAVWDSDGVAASLDDLPISESLRDRILRWQHWYDRECEDYLPPEDRTTDFDVESFSAEGRVLALAIKEVLPDWTVMYFDEARSAAVRGTNAPRSEFEYEIKRT